ncbi:DUF6319 family protein [Rhodococcus yananensis]|uniref:DUF6319 family protein n=1 Tax=Rhodococcus yananensis TaxID=2879464 RepID=UPI003EB82390
MPPRKRDHLTPDQLTELSAAIAEGRRATVYLVEGIPSLGIAPGASARAVAVSGNTVTVRPKGVDDELPFEADELRATREPAQARTAAAKKTTAAPATRRPADTPASSTPASKVPSPKPTAAPVAPKATQEKTPVTQPSTGTAAAADAPKPRPARKPAKKQPAITITVTIDPENEWTVGVAQGTKKIGKPAPVTPDAVERAVRALGDETAVEAVQSVIDEARRAAEDRVAQLSRELEEARKALESLGAGS